MSGQLCKTGNIPISIIIIIIIIIDWTLCWRRQTCQSPYPTTQGQQRTRWSQDDANLERDVMLIERRTTAGTHCQRLLVQGGLIGSTRMCWLSRVTTRSRVCPWWCLVELNLTCWNILWLARIFNSLPVSLSFTLSTWMLKSPRMVSGAE